MASTSDDVVVVRVFANVPVGKHYSLKFNLTSTYRYVRISSDPCPYLFYSFIQFFGAV